MINLTYAHVRIFWFISIAAVMSPFTVCNSIFPVITNLWCLVGIIINFVSIKEEDGVQMVAFCFLTFFQFADMSNALTEYSFIMSAVIQEFT